MLALLFRIFLWVRSFWGALPEGVKAYIIQKVVDASEWLFREFYQRYRQSEAKA
jgi:hypothetical protein